MIRRQRLLEIGLPPVLGRPTGGLQWMGGRKGGRGKGGVQQRLDSPSIPSFMKSKEEKKKKWRRITIRGDPNPIFGLCFNPSG